MQQITQLSTRITLVGSDLACKHTRIGHGGSAVYECLECGSSVPFSYVANLAIAQTSAAALRKREQERAEALRLWEPLRARSAQGGE
jgi:hypothetical protein